MNIGFDLDKVFIDYPPLVPSNLINFLYKRPSKKTLQYRIPKKSEQLFRQISHISFLRPLIKNNFEILEYKSFKRKHKHFLISSRFSFLKKRTNHIIEKYQFDKLFDGMFFNFKDEQPHFFKNRIIGQLKIHRYIDDDLDLLKFLSKKNKKTLFYWLNDKINKKLTPNLFAVKSLESVFKKNTISE